MIDSSQRHESRRAGVCQWIPGLGLILMLAGCAAYQLGPTNHRIAGAQSIQVNPFVNQTIEPRLTVAIGNALRKDLQQDGTYQLDTHDTGDIIVNGTITKFNRTYLSFDPKDVVTPRDYQLEVTALVVATERSTSKVVMSRIVSGHATIRVGSDVNSAENRAVPLLAENLAKKASSLLTDGDW